MTTNIVDFRSAAAEQRVAARKAKAEADALAAARAAALPVKFVPPSRDVMPAPSQMTNDLDLDFYFGIVRELSMRLDVAVPLMSAEAQADLFKELRGRISIAEGDVRRKREAAEKYAADVAEGVERELARRAAEAKAKRKTGPRRPKA